MSLPPETLLGLALLLVPVGFMAHGGIQLRRAGRTGGLHAGLARLVLDPRRVRRFFLYLSAEIVALLVAGGAGAADLIDPKLAEVLGPLQAAAFLAGCGALVLLMRNGVAPRPLTLAEEQRLEGADASLLAAVRRSEPVTAAAFVPSMYLAPQITLRNPEREMPRFGDR